MAASGLDSSETPGHLTPPNRHLDQKPPYFVEIKIRNPETHGTWPSRYTDYEVAMRTDIPHFRFKLWAVRRRYKDFVWLKKELERECNIDLPPLPGKAWKRQLPFGGSLFDPDFIEERRKELEVFANLVARCQSVQNQKSLQMFLQDFVRY